MKKIAIVIIVTVMLILCFSLSACVTKYVSNYSASRMTETKTLTKAYVSFSNFGGVYVIKFQNTGNDEMCITYNATLQEGNIKVYYDFNDEKLDLFEIGANGSAEGKTEAFTGGKIIYIVIESDVKNNAGSFSFALEKSEK